MHHAMAHCTLQQMKEFLFKCIRKSARDQKWIMRDFVLSKQKPRQHDPRSLLFVLLSIEKICRKTKQASTWRSAIVIWSAEKAIKLKTFDKKKREKKFIARQRNPINASYKHVSAWFENDRKLNLSREGRLKNFVETNSIIIFYFCRIRCYMTSRVCFH